MLTATLLQWLPLVFSLIALAGAAVAIWKLRALQFCPEVLAGDVILPRRAHPGVAGRLLLPLQFTNAGHAGGIVEWVALRLTPDGDAARSVLLSPVAEVDMQRFIQARRQLNPENMLEPFTGFALDARRALSKFIVFDVAERPRAAPLALAPGRYAFELFIKAGGSPRPTLERTFEHVIEQKHLDDQRDDLAVYLINYQITLPGVRRTLADQEWMPRTREAELAH